MADYVPRLKEKYYQEIRRDIKNKYSYSNDMMIPQLEKIVLNIGVGEADIAASIDNPPDKKAPSPLIKITLESGLVFFAERANGTPTPSILNVPG